MKLFIIFLVAIFALVGCKKNKPQPDPNAPYYQFSAEGLSYIQLPINSHFIYRDSVTGFHDSVVVVTSAVDKVYVPTQGTIFNGNFAYYHQVYTLKMKSTLSSDTWFSGTASSTSSDLFTFDTYHNSMKYAVFIYPVTSRLITSMVVEGKVYLNVEQYDFEHISAIDAENISVVYYWAKGVGIIKRQIKTSAAIKSESLIRHG